MRYRATSQLRTGDKRIEGGETFSAKDCEPGDLEHFLKHGACEPYEPEKAEDASGSAELLAASDLLASEEEQSEEPKSESKPKRQGGRPKGSGKSKPPPAPESPAE